VGGFSLKSCVCVFLRPEVCPTFLRVEAGSPVASQWSADSQGEEPSEGGAKHGRSQSWEGPSEGGGYF
jgi:hypothetical protein